MGGAFYLATAPAEALAAENGYDPAHIVLIDPDELGVQVIDVASGLALSGAHVTITSYAEGATQTTIEGYTDASGVWVARVRDMCEPDGLATPIKTYAFYARIDVSKEGYRPFTTALVRAVAGQGLAVSTQPIVEGLPYPRLASLNEYDILYTASEFIRSTENEALCALELLVENLPTTAQAVSAQLCQGDDALSDNTRFSAQDHAVLVSFEGTFLKAGSGRAFSAGAGFSIVLTYASKASSTTRMTVPLNLVVMDPPEGVASPLTDKDVNALFAAEAPDGMLAADKKRTFSPFNRSSVEDPGLSFPKDWPVIGGQKLKIWTPETWLGFAVDPFGFIRLSMKTPPLGMKDKYGKKQEDREWGFHPRADARKQVDDYWNRIEKQKEKSDTYLGDWDPFWQEGLNPEVLTRDQPTKKLSITAVGELAAILQWKTKGYIPIYSAEDLEGIGMAHVMAGINYTYKQQFLAGGMPMIFTFSVGANLDVSVNYDMTSPSFKELALNNYKCDLSKSGFVLNFCITGSISLGAGIDGLMSASLKGTLNFTFYLCVSRDPAHDTPHIAFYLGFSAKVVLQFLLFTYEWTPLPELQEKVSGKEPLWDNWASSSSFAHMLSAGSDGRVPLYEFLNGGAKIVDSDTLAQSSEFTCGARLGAEDIAEEHLVGMLERTTETFECEDGTSYTMDVYVPVEAGLFEELKDLALMAMGETDGDETSFSSLLAAMGEDDGEDTDVLFVFGADGDDLDAMPSFGSDGRYSFDRPDPRIAGLGLTAGVCPTSEVCMSREVFSDPRSKVVSIFGRPCIVRVATVELSTGDARTRLVLQEIPSDDAYGAPVLLDFKLSVGRYPRYEYYDYSFDVCETTTTDENGRARTDLHLLVLSGRRDDDDETTLVGAAQGHVFSYVRYAFTNPDDLSERYAVAMQVTPDKICATDCPDSWDNHLYLTPQIKLTEDSSGQKACVMTFVDRAGKTEDGVLRDESANQTRVGVGMFFAKVDDGGRKDAPPVLSLPDLSMLREKIGDMDDLTMMEMSLTGQASGLKTIRFSGENTHYLLLDVNPAFKVKTGLLGEAVSAPGIQDILRVNDETIADVIGAGEEADPDEEMLFDDTQLNLQEVPGQDYFLTCIDGMLQKVTWEIRGGEPYPKLEPCGPEGVQINSFTVDPSGEYIYWPAVADGDAPVVLDDEGEMKPAVRERAYRIMACRMRNGEFSKPFLLAEQGTHGFDNLEVLENAFEGMSFVSCDVVDPGEARANIWFTVVPHLRSLTVAYLAAQSAIVHAGDEVSFRIALRNDGNTYLKQATIRLQSADGQVLGDHVVEFSGETTLVSQWNPQDENGKPTGVEPDFALAPGATSLYRMDGFKVAENAPHDLYVYASVVENTLGMAETDGSMLMAKSSVREFLGVGFKQNAEGERVDAGEFLVTVLDGEEVAVDVTPQRPSHVTFSTDDDSQGSGQNGSKGSDGSGSKGSNTYRLAGSSVAGMPRGGPAYGPGNYTGRPSYSSPYGKADVRMVGTGGSAGGVAGIASGVAPYAGAGVGAGANGSVGAVGGVADSAGAGTTASTAGSALGSGTIGSGASRASLPITGDDTPSMGMAAGALAAAGAAFLAYSHRRERIERETDGRG